MALSQTELPLSQAARFCRVPVRPRRAPESRAHAFAGSEPGCFPAQAVVGAGSCGRTRSSSSAPGQEAESSACDTLWLGLHPKCCILRRACEAEIATPFRTAPADPISPASFCFGCGLAPHETTERVIFASVLGGINTIVHHHVHAGM